MFSSAISLLHQTQSSKLDAPFATCFRYKHLKGYFFQLPIVAQHQPVNGSDRLDLKLPPVGVASRALFGTFRKRAPRQELIHHLTGISNVLSSISTSGTELQTRGEDFQQGHHAKPDDSHGYHDLEQSEASG